MANLTGNEYITFGKPYLNKVADIIKERKELMFEGGVHEVVTMSKEIKSFLDAVKKQNENAVKSVLMNGSSFNGIFNGKRWTQIDKSQFTGKGGDGGGGSDAKSTAMQEIASLFAIRKGIESNGYSDQKQFYKLLRKEMLEIYTEMDEDWENTFFQQQVTTVRELGKSKFTEYSRDDGFMDWITKFVKKKYNIAKKDSWNPADIWLVNDLAGVKKTLEKKIIDNVTSLPEFNAILRDMWSEKKVIGISLKKMSGRVAKWELVNLKDMDLFDNKEYQFTVDQIVCDLSLKSKNEFTSSDSKIKLNSKSQVINFQIRQNGTGFVNLKVEGTDVAAGAARLGKAPLEMVTNLFNEFGLTFDNNNKNFSRSSDEFEKDFDKKWKPIFNSIKKYTKVASADTFKSNMMAVFASKRPDFPHTKLMQMKFIAEILKLDTKKQNQLLTSLAFVAQKKGAVFGPFGKLY